ncbi:MAG: hypothetical protein Q9164_007812, partial [Protoblastenia rupestris]
STKPPPSTFHYHKLQLLTHQLHYQSTALNKHNGASNLSQVLFTHVAASNMSSLKDVLQKSSSYLSTTARLFGVDPWPLECMPDKIPESLPEVLQSVKSPLAYFLRQWAEVEDHLNQETTNLAEAESAKIQHYALGDKISASFHEE